MNDMIVIKGLRQNNLKNISVEIPRNCLVAVTGISGSGKSSFVFDALYAEARKRLLDCFSPYERSRLKRLNEVDVDYIGGLSTVIAISQERGSTNPRSTVGTMTGIYDYVRLLFSRASNSFCPYCKKEINVHGESQIIDRIYSICEGEKVEIYSLVFKSTDETYQEFFQRFVKKGCKEFNVNGVAKKITNNMELDDCCEYRIEALVATIIVSTKSRKDIKAAIAKAVELSGGIISLHLPECLNYKFYDGFGCIHCKTIVKELPVSAFSFNSPYGACPTCTGIGTQYKIDPDLIIPDKTKSLSEGAINLLDFKLQKDKFISNRLLFEGLADSYGFRLDTPVGELPENILKIILYGTNGKKFKVQKPIEGAAPYSRSFEGLVNHVKRVNALRKSSVEQMFQYEGSNVTRKCVCPDCKGLKLDIRRLNYRVGGVDIQELCRMSISEIKSFIEGISLEYSKEKVGKPIIAEILNRIGILNDIGLGYLTLSRETHTLSGGELQRIKISTQLDAGLIEMIYILDEPTIGLHARDTEKMICILKKLRDTGNSVIVVEHDEDVISAADHIIDVGPGSGVSGGRIVAQGSLETILASNLSETGLYMSSTKKIERLMKPRKGNGQYIEIVGAKENNLKNLSVKMPLGVLICVTGVSGSGKSSLVSKILFEGINSLLMKTGKMECKCDEIRGVENITGVLCIDQSPVGRNSRSNVATYIGVFDSIRKLFADTPKAKEYKYKMSRFSFNETEGRCDVCAGLGTITTQMHFMPDIEVLCEACQGKRYNSDTLEIKYKDKNIIEVLGMTVDEACTFFSDHQQIYSRLSIMNELGMGYIKLGQPLPTLSGGEAQRIKLCYQLGKNSTEQHNLYVLDEPTTGLHLYDIHKLTELLNKLVDNNNTVVVIEHNLHFIKTADYIIDLGPCGGNNGGFIVAEGTPEDISKVKESVTGQYIKRLL